jgi:8-oxo-dGTP pyrophosphatase MutT (NUDIX family)
MRNKPDSFYVQSGVIPFRMKRGEMQVLLVTSTGSGRWVIPKGIVEPDLSAADSAAKEAWEEAGIEGRVYPVPVGTYQRAKWGGRCTVEVFLMEVEEVWEDWPEAYRRRKWRTVDEAAALVKEKGLKRLLRRAPAVLATLTRGA